VAFYLCGKNSDATSLLKNIKVAELLYFNKKEKKNKTRAKINKTEFVLTCLNH